MFHEFTICMQCIVNTLTPSTDESVWENTTIKWTHIDTSPSHFESHWISSNSICFLKKSPPDWLIILTNQMMISQLKISSSKVLSENWVADPWGFYGRTWLKNAKGMFRLFLGQSHHDDQGGRNTKVSSYMHVDSNRKYNTANWTSSMGEEKRWR